MAKGFKIALVDRPGHFDASSGRRRSRRFDLGVESSEMLIATFGNPSPTGGAADYTSVDGTTTGRNLVLGLRADGNAAQVGSTIVESVPVDMVTLDRIAEVEAKYRSMHEQATSRIKTSGLLHRKHATGVAIAIDAPVMNVEPVEVLGVDRCVSHDRTERRLCATSPEWDLHCRNVSYVDDPESGHNG